MKISLVLTVLILAIGGGVGWRQHGRLERLADDQRVLETKASRLGVPIAGGDPRALRRPRSGGRSVAITPAQWIAFARELQLYQADGRGLDEGFRQRLAEAKESLMDLDPGQLRDLIAGLRAEPDLTDSTRSSLILFAMKMLAEEQPAAALELFSGNSDLFGEGWMDEYMLGTALGRWGQLDPAAALAWLRSNPPLAGMAMEDAKRVVIAGSALTDPKLALKLIRELPLADPAIAVDALIEQANTPARRTELLAALREHLAGLPDREASLNAALEGMGLNLRDESFDSVQTWLTGAGLSSNEKASFAAGLSYDGTQEDTGHWIDWVSANLPESAIREHVGSLIGQWTEQDYLAAGKWLSAAPEGPAKQAAVATYAATVAEYDPQIAVRWAITLPVGPQRQETLEAIHHHWPKGDFDAASAFAKEYGIEMDPEPAAEDP